MGPVKDLPYFNSKLQINKDTENTYLFVDNKRYAIITLP